MTEKRLRSDRLVLLFGSVTGPYANLTLQAFAETSQNAARLAGSGALGFSLGSLENWRAGRVSPNPGNLKTLAYMLDTTPEYLLGKTDNPRPGNPGASELAKHLSQLPDEQLRRFFDQVAEKVIDYRPDAPIQSNFQEAALSGIVSDDPDKLEGFWNSLPRFYRREEARMRSIVFDSVSFIHSGEYRDADPKQDTDGQDAPSQDWLDAFRRHAPTSPTGPATRLWSAVLAREFRKPGTFSVRTLMTMSGLPEEVFANLLRFSGALIRVYDPDGSVVGEYYIRPTDDKGPRHYLAMFGLDYDDILQLEESGFVRLNHRDLTLPPETVLSYGFGQDQWHMTLRQEKTISVNALTQPARELRPLYQGAHCEEYFKGVHKGLGKRVATPYRRSKK